VDRLIAIEILQLFVLAWISCRPEVLKLSLIRRKTQRLAGGV